MRDFKEAQVIWIDDNKHVFTNSNKATQFERDYIYSIYNHLFETDKKPNGCGRCWQTTKDQVYQQFKKLKLF